MAIDDWHQRWRENKIAFHETDVNRYLQSYFFDFQLSSEGRIFMPLCGKAHDITWLADQGYEVIGIELSDIAINAFFSENGLSHQKFQAGSLVLHRAKNISIIQGDFFDLTSSVLGECDMVYDRAALIALNFEDRARYVEHMNKLLPKVKNHFIVNLEYSQEQMNGPPFSVSKAEIESHYSDQFNIKLLETNDIIEERQTWKERGLTALTESVYRLDRK
ncbi:MAG: thiopurine S-methyltransferase [Gammaproteobacteria bacterium]|jgi:thiopurine S-methyltransferase